jgi:hypothetical protein
LQTEIDNSSNQLLRRGNGTLSVLNGFLWPNREDACKYLPQSYGV